jgi:hypothetical protein
MFAWKSPRSSSRLHSGVVRRARAVRPCLEQVEARQLLSGVATVMQNTVQEDRFYVDLQGTLEVQKSINGGPWQAPQPIPAPGAPPAGAGVAAVSRANSEVDVFYVDTYGAVRETFEVNNGPWHNVLNTITLPGETTPGAGIAAVVRSAAREDVFYIGTSGQVKMVSDILGIWQMPQSITIPGVAPTGGVVAAAVRGKSDSPNGPQEDVFFVAQSGQLEWTWETNNGNFQKTPSALPNGKVPVASGTSIAAIDYSDFVSVHEGEKVHVFFVGKYDGEIYDIYSNGGPWSAPEAITHTTMDYRPYGLTASLVIGRQVDITAFWEFTLFGRPIYFFDNVNLPTIIP